MRSPTDAQLFTDTHDTLMDLTINGDLLCFDGKLYGDWTVYVVTPEECFRPPDTFRQNTRPNDLRKRGMVLSKATIQAAQELRLSNAALARMMGLTELTMDLIANASRGIDPLPKRGSWHCCWCNCTVR